MLFRTIHLVSFQHSDWKQWMMVNHVKKSVTRDRIYALKSEFLIDRKLGKNAKASSGFNLCVFIRFPDLAFVKRAINKYGWLAIVVPTWNHEKNARVSDSERDEKSVSNNTRPQATVFWRFEVEKPLAEASVKKSSLKFNNVIWKRLAPLDHRMSQKQMCSTFSVM